MINEILEERFQQEVGEKVRLFKTGDERYKIFSPFVLTDGDHLAITLRKENGRWLLSDGGSTFMHLSFGMDERELLEGNRSKIIASTLLATNVSNRDGELIAEVKDNDYGAALYRFAQALIKISDISYLSREMVKSTFVEDFRNLIEDSLPRESFEFDWYDQERDPQKLYQIDCKVNSNAVKPLFIYALRGDDRVTAATISIYKFQDWNLPFHPVAFFENKNEINRKVLSRFNSVCDRQYDFGERAKFSEYIHEKLQLAEV
jgi:hypothetical protein